jgi:uncharacterized damage-inducible protein DinB
MTTDLRFPVGKFTRPTALGDAERETAIVSIAALPTSLRVAVDGFSAQQFDTPYRPDGWTVRQLVHHVPDSHMNAYVRFKLALTEDRPTIKPYEEARWAELPDSAETPIDVSLTLTDALHSRWTTLLRAMTPEDFTRSLMHPANGEMRLDQMLALYSWHGRHHVAHITALRERMGW